MIAELQHIDEVATLWLNQTGGGFCDPVMQVFSNKTIWAPLYVAIAVYTCIRLGWKAGLIVILAAIIGFGICDQISNLIKDSVCRFRPCWNDFMVDSGLRILEKKGGKFGFFSAHAANSFCFVTITYMGLKNDKRKKYALYIYAGIFWAFMVSISRVFVGKHFIGDITAGTAIGIAVGFAIAVVTKRIITRLEVLSPSQSNGNL